MKGLSYIIIGCLASLMPVIGILLSRAINAQGFENLAIIASVVIGMAVMISKIALDESNRE